MSGHVSYTKFWVPDPPPLSPLPPSHTSLPNPPLSRYCTQGVDHDALVQAALEAKHEASALFWAALSRLLELEVDFPEVVRFLQDAVPRVLLPKWAPGRTLADFEAVEPLDGPSRHVMYRAHAQGRAYAIKSFMVHPTATARCLREAARLVRAAHPHIVEVRVASGPGAAGPGTWSRGPPAFQGMGRGLRGARAHEGPDP